MLNPINHSSTRAAIQRYKVEPYAVSADVYSQAPHVGRGGWTWYTGSAGWMYRPVSSGYSDFVCEERSFSSTHAFRKRGRDLKSHIVTGRRATRSRSRTRGKSVAESPAGPLMARHNRHPRRNVRAYNTRR